MAFSILAMLNSEALKESSKLKVIFKMLAKMKIKTLNINCEKLKSRYENFEMNSFSLKDVNK